MLINQNPKNDTTLGNCETVGTDDKVRSSAERELGVGWRRCNVSRAEWEFNLEQNFGRWMERTSLVGEEGQGHSE